MGRTGLLTQPCITLLILPKRSLANSSDIRSCAVSFRLLCLYDMLCKRRGVDVLVLEDLP